MKKAYLLAVFLLLLSSCEDDEKIRYGLMERAIKQPDNLEKLILKFPKHTQPFIDEYIINKENREAKMDFVISMIKRYFPTGKSSIACDRKFQKFNRNTMMQALFHEVIYKGEADNRYLRFEWIFEVNRYRLNNIEIVSELDCTEDFKK